MIMLPNKENIKSIPPYDTILWALKRHKKDISELENFGFPLEIIQNKLKISSENSMILGSFFNVESDYFLELQKLHDEYIIEENEQLTQKPNTQNIRKVVFWDTNFEKINWIKYKKSIIHRIFERGNTQEKQEIINFYGKNEVLETLTSYSNQNLSNESIKNLHKYSIPITFGLLLQTK